STKTSGSPAGCGTQSVLDLGYRYPELCGQCLDVVARPKPLKDIAHASRSVGEDRLAERTSRIGHNLGSVVRRKADQLRVAVGGVLDAPEVLLDDFTEHALAAANDDELLGCGSVLAGRPLRVVEQHLGAVRVQRPRCERMRDPDLTREHVKSRTYTLQRYPHAANGGQHHALGETNEGNRGVARLCLECGHDGYPGE